MDLISLIVHAIVFIVLMFFTLYFIQSVVTTVIAQYHDSRESLRSLEFHHKRRLQEEEAEHGLRYHRQQVYLENNTPLTKIYDLEMGLQDHIEMCNLARLEKAREALSRDPRKEGEPDVELANDATND